MRIIISVQNFFKNPFKNSLVFCTEKTLRKYN